MKCPLRANSRKLALTAPEGSVILPATSQTSQKGDWKMSSIWALQDAKSKFSAVVDRACEIEPQIVTRRGKPVVVMISYSEYRALSSPSRSPIDVLLGGPKVDGGLPITRDKSPARRVVFA